MRKSIASILTILFAFPGPGKAQQRPAGDTVLKSATIEVIQSYKPEVKKVPRPEVVPVPPPRDTSHPVLSFEVPQQSLYFTYSSLPIRPLALGRDTSREPFSSYLKLGGGNLSTFYFDAGIAHLRGDNYESAIHLHHLSQQGNIGYQQLSRSGFEADGWLHGDVNEWHAGISGFYDQYHLYGYDHKTYDYSEKYLRQPYTGLELSADMKNAAENRWGLNYQPGVKLWVYGRDFNADEKAFELDLPFSADVDTSLRLGMGVKAQVAYNSFFGQKDYSNNIFQLTPRIDFHSGGFHGTMGVYPTFGKDKITYLLPDVRLGYAPGEASWSLELGLQSLLRQNTYRQLSSYNPYLDLPYTAKQTRSDEIFAQAAGRIGDHLKMDVRVSWWQWKNLPLFLNDAGDGKSFYFLHDPKVNALSLQAGVRYNVADAFSAGVSASLFSYYQHTFDRVWHEPGIRLKGDIIWYPVPALSVTAYLNMMDQIYALNQFHEEKKLDAVFDLGGGAEYSFIPRLSAFVNLNNLLNNAYQRWYRYDAFGANVYGGLRLKF